MLALSPLFVRPFSQQPSENQPSSQPFVFFLLPETQKINTPYLPVLVAVVLPSQLFGTYRLSEILALADNDFLSLYPLSEAPFFDEPSHSFLWLFFGSYEINPEQPTTSLHLSAHAFFAPFDPSLPPLAAFDELTLTVDGSWSDEKEGKEATRQRQQATFSIRPMVATTEVVCCCVTVDGEGCVCPSPCYCPCCGGTEPEGGTNPPPDDGGSGDEGSNDNNPPPDDGGSGDEGNDGSTPPPDDGNPPPDEEEEEDPPSPCGGITYLTPFPSLFGSIVEPEAKEVTVCVGETVTFKANGFPDPDLDRQISRAPNPEGECVSSAQTRGGPPLFFTWRLWKDNDRDGQPDVKVGVIGWGKEIQWQVPTGVGEYCGIGRG